MQTRPDDWRCECGFWPNFEWRTRCFSCNKPRRAQQQQQQQHTGGAKNGNLAAGPVGANGLRPQLRWNREKLGPQPQLGEKSTTHRVPGSSMAARHSYAAAAAIAAAKAPKAQVEEEKDAPKPKGPSRELDEDGLQKVPYKKKGAKSSSTGAAGGAGVGEHDGDAVGDEDMEDVGHDSRRKEAAGGHEEDEPNVVDEEADPTSLQRKWREETALVKKLAQQGLPAEHPAMVAACKARDDAEKRGRKRQTRPNSTGSAP